MWLKMKRTSLKFGRGNLWQNVCTVEGNWIISTDNKCKDRHWFFAQNQGRTLHSVVYSRLTESIPKIQTKQQKTGPLINVLLDVSLLYFINCLPEFTAWSFPGCFAVPPPPADTSSVYFSWNDGECIYLQVTRTVNHALCIYIFEVYIFSVILINVINSISYRD